MASSSPPPTTSSPIRNFLSSPISYHHNQSITTPSSAGSRSTADLLPSSPTTDRLLFNNSNNRNHNLNNYNNRILPIPDIIEPPFKDAPSSAPPSSPSAMEIEQPIFNQQQQQPQNNNLFFPFPSSPLSLSNFKSSSSSPTPSDWQSSSEKTTTETNLTNGSSNNHDSKYQSKISRINSYKQPNFQSTRGNRRSSLLMNGDNQRRKNGYLTSSSDNESCNPITSPTTRILKLTQRVPSRSSSSSSSSISPQAQQSRKNLANRLRSIDRNKRLNSQRILIDLFESNSRKNSYKNGTDSNGGLDQDRLFDEEEEKILEIISKKNLIRLNQNFKDEILDDEGFGEEIVYDEVEVEMNRRNFYDSNSNSIEQNLLSNSKIEEGEEFEFEEEEDPSKIYEDFLKDQQDQQKRDDSMDVEMEGSNETITEQTKQSSLSGLNDISGRDDKGKYLVLKMLKDECPNCKKRSCFSHEIDGMNGSSGSNDQVREGGFIRCLECDWMMSLKDLEAIEIHFINHRKQFRDDDDHNPIIGHFEKKDQNSSSGSGSDDRYRLGNSLIVCSNFNCDEILAI